MATGGVSQESEGSNDSISKPGPSEEQSEDKPNITWLMESWPPGMKHARHSSEGNENTEDIPEKDSKSSSKQPSKRKVTFKLDEESNRHENERNGNHQQNRHEGEANRNNHPNQQADEERGEGNQQADEERGEGNGNQQADEDRGEGNGNQQADQQRGEGNQQANQQLVDRIRNQQRRGRNRNPRPPRVLRGRWAREEEPPLVVVEPIFWGMLRNVAQQTEKIGSHYKNRTCRENFKFCYFNNVHEIGHSWVIFLFQFLVGCLAASAIVMGIVFIRSCVGASPATVPVFTILMGLSGGALLYKWVKKVCRERRGDRYWNSEKNKLAMCFFALLFCMVLELIFFRNVSSSNLQGADDVKCDKIYVTYMYCLHIVNGVVLALAALLYLPDCVSYISNFKFWQTSNANGEYQPL